MTSFQKVIKYCAIVFAIILTVSIIGGILRAVASITFIFGGRDAAGDMKIYNISKTIDELDIDISAANFEIQTDDDFRIESNHKYLSVLEKNGKLKISENKSIWTSYSGTVKIIIYIPESTIFNNVKIVTGAGKVTFSKLNTETLDLELGAGEASIDSLTAEESADIDGGAGKVTISGGALNNLDLDMGVGGFDLTSRLSGDCDLDYGVGSAELTLLGDKDDYRIEIDKGLGNATIDGKEMRDGEIYGNGENKIYIDGGVGKIEIKFKDF